MIRSEAFSLTNRAAPNNSVRACFARTVLLSLGNGDLHNGFPAVTAQLWEHGNLVGMQFVGSLPAAPELLELYRYWQLLYSALYQRLDLNLRIEIEEADVTNVSEVEFSDLCQRLSDSINAWLNSEPFRNIDQQLRTQLHPSEEIRVIIETSDRFLRRLPWHLWKFFEHYPRAEVALSTPEYQRPQKSFRKTFGNKARILAILGNSQGINIDKDRCFLEQLSDQAETEFLVEPQPEELNERLWQDWDILFFAGHSSSTEKGRIQLNQTDSLTLEQLKYSLKKAISRGLKLAIFNSCDGLGLAQALCDLQMAQVIVMREPVPDVVAQEFLRHFLAGFSGGQSLYSAVRYARERLQKLEFKYPCATWLPVICQNPAEEPTTWQDLCPEQKSDPTERFIRVRQPLLKWRRLQTVLILSVVVAALIMGLRHLGILQPWELQAYDHLMQSRPVEVQDQRLLLITIDEADIRYQTRMKMKMRGSLSDQALAQLLEKLEQYQPQTIGLDIYRDFSVDPSHADLATRFRQDDSLIGLCKVPAAEDGDPYGVPPPSEIPEQRLGFSDFVQDDDVIVRRHLLQLTPPLTSPCAADQSFSLVLALHYLKASGINHTVTEAGELQIGDVVFEPLKPHAGGYHQGVNASDYQVLLNYRSLTSLRNIAQEISLTDILNDQVNPELVESAKHRIVLIGVTAPSTNDYWKTPYSATVLPSEKEIPGVLMQAQMVSHILSAVLDHRPLLWWWPEWVEALWVWGWAIVGGTIAWRIRHPLHLGLAGVIALGTIFGICFGIFTHAGWVPLVPSALALLATELAVVWWFATGSHLRDNITRLDA